MKYSSMKTDSLPLGRRKLVKVIRMAGDVIEIDDAVKALSIRRTEASKLLSRWAKQGWLRRVGRGAYVAAPIDSLESQHVLDDPWVLIPTLFEPAYIGGWTAAEHWDLTEQLFREIMVMTAQTVRQKNQIRHGTEFHLNHIDEARMFGTKPVWRGRSKVAISDVHRTIIDMIDVPTHGGGIQHVADCFSEYLARSDRNEETLIAYADRLGNGAIFKRLGLLAELLGASDALIEACANRLTQGNAKLDPNLPCNRLISRWRVIVPDSWAQRLQK